MKTSVFVLKEINQLSSGEVGFYVEIYEKFESAQVAMSEQSKEHVENNQAYVVSEDECSVFLEDELQNKYQFNIEELTVR